MKKILITGADGFLAGKLIKKIADSTEFEVIAVSSFPERIPEMIERESISRTEKIKALSSEEFFLSDLKSYDICGFVHYAFSRAMFPNKDIANSIDYCYKVYSKIVDSDITNSIYLSSQSVYGDYPYLRTEEVTPEPNSIYAMAKYAGEKVIEACYRFKPNLQYSFLRMDNVIQSQNLVRALCKNAKDSGVINLTGGKQVFSYIDAEETADAIYALLNTKKKWSHIYNVGADRMQATLVEVAETVKEIAKENGQSVHINLNECDVTLWSGMNIDLFMNDTGWKPQKSLKDMVRNIYKCI